MYIRKFLKKITVGFYFIQRVIIQHFCKAWLNTILFLYNVPHGNVKTGGGIFRIRISRKGVLKIGDNVNFANKWEVGYPLKSYIRIKGSGVLTIGNNVGINSSLIFCDNSITIGNHVHIGGGCKVFDNDFHNMNYMDRRDPVLNGLTKTSPVVIEDDVFIGTSSIICKGVTIGARSIVAAGSVVTKSIPHDEMWGGNPAKFIKKINIQ